jgi:heptosyltransferase-2
LPDKAKLLRVALVPGGASNMLRQQTLRRWPVELYAQLARELTLKGMEVVLIGGPEDGWVRPAFEGQEVLDRVGILSLPEVIAAFDTCDLVISHDTGPMHMAGVSGAHLLALFGPTDPSSFLPRRNGVRAIWGGQDLACRPCYDGSDFPACPHNGCMRAIPVSFVLRQAEEMIAERGRGAASPWRIVDFRPVAAVAGA